MTVATTAAVIFFMKLFDYVDEVDYRRRSRLERSTAYVRSRIATYSSSFAEISTYQVNLIYRTRSNEERLSYLSQVAGEINSFYVS